MFETVAREQMMDCLAARLGIDPLELRRRNVIREDELPYTLASGMVYDQMTAAANLEQAAEMIGYDELRAEQEAWRKGGRLVGIGVSLFPEPSAMAFGWMTTDGATVRIGQNGHADVLTSAASHGQSLETTIAQVVADELGLDIAHVRVLQGDTDSAPLGPGTGGSRSAVIAGTAAVHAAREVRARMVAIVAHALEASPEDLEVVDGRVQVVGTPTTGHDVRRGRAEGVHRAGQPAARCPARARSPGPLHARVDLLHLVERLPHLRVRGRSRHRSGRDPALRRERGLRRDDQPNVVEGQIAGGVVQGIGGVLYEHLPYDDAGNPLATTFVDYLLPTATEVPVIEYGHIETPAPTNPGGHKGLGEGGAIGAPPAIINAIADALAPLGAQVRSQPLGPDDVLALIEAAS